MKGAGMRDLFTTILELVGIFLLVAAAALLNLILGVAVLGVALILVGWLLGRNKS